VIDEREIVRVAVERLAPPEPAYERMLHRRDRKRRNQRIAAGAVGIGVFVAAVWIVTTVGSSDRTTPAAPGGAETGPAETGWLPLKGEVTRWLPPEGAEPSTPADGKLVVSGGDMSPWWSLQVYADGRVIWLNERYATSFAHAFWQERRLTPEGIELLRSGVKRLGGQFHGTGSKLPASAWEDPEAKSYVPSRYVVCASHETMRFLPQRTQDLLHGYTNERAVIRGEDEFSRGGPGFACPAVTIEEARALDKIFLEVGLSRAQTIGSLVYSGTIGSIDLIPLLPDGTLGSSPKDERSRFDRP
jgi:hypothetical protein